MSFWEEHKKLILGVAAALLVLLILHPSFSDGRPGIVWPYSSGMWPYEKGYNALSTYKKGKSVDIDKYYNPRHTRMSKLITEATHDNAELGAQYRDLRNYVIFIPPMPFMIKESDVQKGLTLLTIQSDTHRSKLLQYLAQRDIVVDDPYFGMNIQDRPVPSLEKDLPLLLRQLAMIDDLMRKAAQCGMRKVINVQPMNPFQQGPIEKPHFLRVYPVRLTISAPVESIMRFVNGLNGYHGKVTAFADPAAATDPSKRKRVIIDVGRKAGLGNDNMAGGAAQLFFTIFDESLNYKCRAQIVQINDDNCIAEILDDSYPPTDEPADQKAVSEGDLATTNFYMLLDLSIRANKPEENRLTNEIEAEISVGSVGLLEDAKTTAKENGRPAPDRKMRKPPTRRFGGY